MNCNWNKYILEGELEVNMKTLAGYDTPMKNSDSSTYGELLMGEV
jgi:hypothetical protein